MSRSIVHVRRKRKDADPLRSAWHILEEWLEVNRTRIVAIGAIAIGLILVVAILYYFLEYREQQQQRAFAAAYEKFTAPVGGAPALPGAIGAPKTTYPDAKAKYTDAAQAFMALSDDYSAYEDVGRYYAGLSYLEVEPDRGVKLLEEVAGGGSEVQYEARLAVAEHYNRAGDLQKAEAAYDKLQNDPGNLPRFFILTRLGSVKERLGKQAEAAQLYKTVVDADRNSEFGTEAEKGLQRVDPAAAAALPPKASPGGAPFGGPGGPGVQGGAGMPPGMPPGMPGLPPGGPRPPGL